MTHRRWLFYAVNGEGIGHLNRLLALARQIRRHEANAEFLFLTTSEAASVCWQEGFASVKIPSPGSASHTGLHDSTILKLLQTTVPAVLGWYEPSVVVVDTFPSGYRQELAPIFSWPLKRVFVYRETRQEFAGHAGFQAALEQYHRIIVPHPPQMCSLEASPSVALDYVGHMLIRSKAEAYGRAEARQQLGLPADKFLVYVGFGGGGDRENKQLREWVLSAAAKYPHYHFACAVGPLDQSVPIAMAASNVSTFRYWPLAQCWPAFDAAISASGYNSTNELVHFAVPTIWVPLPKPADDQHLRALRLTDQGIGWFVNRYDTQSLEKALHELSDAAQRDRMAAACAKLATRNGAEVAAENLVRWLAQE